VGTVDASETVTIVSRVPGELREIHVADGENVVAGQLLFVIDKKQLEITLSQVQAQLESDQARLVKAEEDLARSQQLTRGGFTSAAQNDEARVAAISLRAAVKADAAALEQARLNLSYCEIRAPLTGRAGMVLVDKGNMVPALSQPLLTIDVHQPVTVTFAVPERHLAAVRAMADAPDLLITARSKTGQLMTGRLTFVGNVDSATGTVPLKASFSNESGLMWPGEFVRLTVRLALLRDCVTVPSRAVIIGQEGTFVYVVDDGMKAHYRLVETGVESEGATVITRGLEAGEKVVMEGHVRLADGLTVRFPESLGSLPPSSSANETATDGAAS
jgi:multidrug efflux system membrane fusion protein